MRNPSGKKYSFCSVLAIFFFISPYLCLGVTARTAGKWPFEIKTRHRPGTYLWSPGSAWDIKDIDWNLEQLADAGFGTVHIIPIYGAKGHENRYLDFLSDEWLAKLEYFLRKAKALGLQIDMTTGTGWCFGGPGLTEKQYDIRATLDKKTGKLVFSGKRMVKRAAPGGVGHMLNPFSSAAMKFYLQRFDKALAKCSLLPRAQYHDSFEYQANWCVDLPAEFSKRRGYNLMDYLDVLFAKNNVSDRSSRIKYDYRLTIAQLHREFIQTWTYWAHARGMLTRDQAHGSPANLLDVYATADIPETEMFGSPEFAVRGFRYDDRFCRKGDTDLRICKMASSAAHVAHKPARQLVSSETCTWMREHWHGTLGQIKLETDLFFLAGINHIFFHGTCYSPKDVPWPGWFFYASTKVDWRNSIWHDILFLNKYIARCQSVLQAGQPANDILLYWPIHDMWMKPDGLLQNLTVHSKWWMKDYPIGDLARQLDEQGYAYDFISDSMLNQIRYDNGVLHATGGAYKVLVVPKCRFMPVVTLKQLATLARQGATIIFQQLPDDVPGFAGLAQRRRAFLAQMARLKHTITVTADIPSALVQAGVNSESMVKHGLRYIRRKTQGAYWYFIANHTENDYSGWLNLAVPFTTAVRHDPMTARSALLPRRQTTQGQQIYLDIASGESLIIQASRTKLEGRPYVPMKRAGNTLALNGTWHIEFIKGGPELPQAYNTDTLSSWTNAPDNSARAFAGTARYTLTFRLPSHINADDYLLDLGDVRESARIKINKRQVTTLFALPMRTRVGQFLHNGSNIIEIEVTNLAANRIRDLDLRKVNWKNMHNANIVNQNYQKFDASNWPLQPSGLLGPVSITPLQKVNISDMDSYTHPD